MTLNELIAEWQKKVIYAKKTVTDGKGGVEDGGEVVVVQWDDKTVTLPAYAKEYLDMFISDCMTAVAEEACWHSNVGARCNLGEGCQTYILSNEQTRKFLGQAV